MVLLGSSVRLGQITSADSAAATGTGPRRVRLFCRFRESYRVASDWSRHLELDWLEVRPLRRNQSSMAVH